MFCRRTSTLGLLLALCTGLAVAAPVSYTLDQGSDGSFQFSFLHDATNAAGLAPYFPGGDKLFRVNGDIDGDFTAGTLTVSPSTLTADGLASGPYNGETWTLEILGGSIDAPVGPFDDSFLGSFDYDLLDPNDVSVDTGTFYFFHGDFGAPAQEVTASSITLWGNNWRNFAIGGDPSQTAGDVPLPLGLDVQANDDTGGPVIPEPASALLFLRGRHRMPRNAASSL